MQYTPPPFPATTPSHTSVTTRDEAPRTRFGQFTGQGRVALDVAPSPSVFTPRSAATGILAAQIDGALDVLLAPRPADAGTAPCPVVALQASPGAGKSRMTRERLAQIEDLDADMVWHTPTLALADEATAHARGEGAVAHVFRGRSALNPATGTPMCAKADLAERVARAGLPVGQALCRRENEDGTVHLCAHFEVCAYQRQRAGLPEASVQRYMSTNYLTLPDPTGRDPALRVVDETFWAGLIRITEVPVDAFTAPRSGLHQPRRDPRKGIAAGQHADLLAAASAVVRLLDAGGTLADLRLTPEDLDAFAEMEISAAPPDPNIRPDQDDAMQGQAIEAVLAALQQARRFRWIWLILAAAMRQGRARSERLTLVRDAEGVRRLRIFGRADLPRNAPLLLLDADADPVILDAVAPGAQVKTLSLRPNAHVVQVEDRRMAHGKLRTQIGLRRSWVAVIRAEVLRDRAGPRGGVLVGATKKVVRQFFIDAGHDLDAMGEDKATAFMLATPLHGARWTWFGGRSLGDNRYRDFSAVAVIGREELPVDALEDQSRALFGDTEGAALAFVEPDAAGRRLLPEAVVPYDMTDGGMWGAHVRVHPDPRIRALQRQSRECATRQLVERLRLAHAAYPKRAILGCNIPIPGLPVDELVRFEHLVPPRMAQACVEAFLAGRPLRLSAPGLHADAPGTFPSPDAAKKFMGRNPLESVSLPTGIGTVLHVRLRLDQRGARTTEALVMAETAAAARKTAEAAYGPLSACEVIACMLAASHCTGVARAD